MTPRFAALGLLPFIAFARIASATEYSPPKTIEELRLQVEKAVKDHDVPAIGIAVVNAQGPVWVAGWGKADLASGKAADENTLFRIGSVTKMFAGLAVLKLVEEGRLSLDDKLRDRAPDVAFENEWEATNPVRIAHLLEHTTGWDDIHLAEYAYSAPDSMTIKQGLDFHPHSRISRWPPGSRHAYNNAGPAVAAYVVEKITGQRYEDYIEKTFFTPLDMTSTTFFKSGAYDERGATLYIGPDPQAYWHIIHRPAGSINSSARDMARFVQFMLMRGATATGPILSDASITRMETPKTLPGNDQGVLAGYALANYTSGHKGLDTAFRGHNGGVMGGLTEFMYVPRLGEGYVIMINSGNGAALGRLSELCKDYLLRGAAWKPVDAPPLPENYKSIDGIYENINPRMDIMRVMSSFNFLKVRHDDKEFHRSPLFGGWESNDYLGPGGALVDRYTGLPTVAIVEDPLAGPVLQVASDTWQRVSGLWVIALFGTVTLLWVMTIAAFVLLIVWAARRKKTGDGRKWMRLWPLIASITLFVYSTLMAMGDGLLNELGTISLLSVTLFFLSLLYPAAVLLGAAQLFKASVRERMNAVYWFAVVFVAVHVLTACYMAIYGHVAMRTWA